MSYYIIRHYVTAQNNVFCLIFITISSPISTSFLDSCESPIGRSSQIFRMIPFKEPKISSNSTSKIIEFRQITRSHSHVRVYAYSSASLVRGFWDEEFFAKKPRTTEVPRTREVHLFWACKTPTCIPFMRYKNTCTSLRAILVQIN